MRWGVVLEFDAGRWGVVEFVIFYGDLQAGAICPTLPQLWQVASRNLHSFAVWLLRPHR